MNNKITESRINKFLRNVSKLDTLVHLRTHDDVLGTVRLQKAGWSNNGKRLYAVSSKVIKSGCYGASALRRAYTSARA